eukprot:gnl/Chilomastix_caulleri/2331.p2 GENE.gnl/Chilomastix_caulleri/2331~~gnl/Chilomastix_caulleri/2331.p2  ORF type:complete len:53 (-),score=5.77 gnl/Chilomastix_caulleri/2331:221-379(-)
MSEFSEAITKILGTYFFNTAWVSTAWSSKIEGRVSTSKKTLTNKVGTITTMR